LNASFDDGLVPLGDVVHLNPDSVTARFPHDFISYIEISAVGSGIIQEEIPRYSLVNAPSRAKRMVSAGDTILSTVRPNRRSFFYFRNATDDLVVSTGFAVLRAREQIDPRFLYYSVTNRAFTDYLTANAKGSAYPAVDVETISRREIWLPPLSTQRKIAAILSAYDDLIENNNRRIKILEEMARAIYREWFVEFRFPGHEKVKMVESELGLIPEGWRLTTVPDAIAVSPTTKADRNTVKPFVAMNCLSNNSMLIAGYEQRAGNSGSKFRNGDTLFARITPCLENGKTGFVQFLPTPDSVATGSTEFIVLRSRTLCPEYVYCLARSDGFRDNAIKSMAGASGRQRVQEGCFDKFIFAHPPSVLVDAFQEIVQPMFRQVHLLSQQSDLLRRTRDLLLPRLVSGELDVSQLHVLCEGDQR
jgi:type I restriction enzyme, S subunit